MPSIPGETRIPEPRGTESGTLFCNSGEADGDLVYLPRVWNDLPQLAQESILAIARRVAVASGGEV